MTASSSGPNPGQPSAFSGPPPLPPYRTGLTYIVILGTTVWFAAFVVLLFFTDELRAHNAMTWLWTCLTGAGLGVVGLAVRSWQRSAARKGRRGAQTSALE